MSRLLSIYRTQFRLELAVLLQYRFGFFMWLLGMVAEPVIYLVVWTTVARSQGGSVGGYTADEFAGYYIAWTLVRQMNIALTPYEFENRVQRGRLSPELLRPAHPFHFDLASFGAMKVVTTLMWIPIAITLYLIFRPSLSPEPWQLLAFLVAIVTGFVMRFILVWALGLATFWVTRVSGIFELYFALELLLSGRLVPLDLMPEWVQRLSNWLPFQWSFGFPLELILGRLSPTQTLYGFGAQAIWAAIGTFLLTLLWRTGVKRYSAVGA
jgi:ABC-2 type transport system permease protein